MGVGAIPVLALSAVVSMAGQLMCFGYGEGRVSVRIGNAFVYATVPGCSWLGLWLVAALVRRGMAVPTLWPTVLAACATFGILSGKVHVTAAPFGVFVGAFVGSYLKNPARGRMRGEAGVEQRDVRERRA